MVNWDMVNPVEKAVFDIMGRQPLRFQARPRPFLPPTGAKQDFQTSIFIATMMFGKCGPIAPFVFLPNRLNRGEISRGWRPTAAGK
jgi:hypothetical protein